MWSSETKRIIVRYAVVGFATFFVDYMVTTIALKFMPLLAANTVGFVVANIANFFMAHRWVFGRHWQRGKLFTQYVSTLGISIVGLALNNLVVWFGVMVAGTTIFTAKVIAAAIVMVWNFAMRAFWVYAEKPLHKTDA